MTEAPPLEQKYAREYLALGLVQRCFGGNTDPRFAAIPILDRIDAVRGIVMWEIAGTPLTRLLPQLSRLYPGRPSSRLRRSIHHSGVWLRRYHELQPEGTSVRQASRDDIIALAGSYCRHLAHAVAQPLLFDELAKRIAEAALRLLPEQLPLGLAHGDFAPRNLLIDERDALIVFDTVALWRTPIYFDLATFSLALRASRPQLYSYGYAFSEPALQQAEQWLFAGYFGDRAAVPHDQIGLHRTLLLLDKWSAELARAPSALRRTRLWLVNSWYGRQANRLSGELNISSIFRRTAAANPALRRA